MLALYALRQAIKRYEYIHAQKRDPDKETSIEANEEYEREDWHHSGTRVPGPDEKAASNEITKMLQQGLAELDEWTRRLVVGVVCRGIELPKKWQWKLGENEHSIGGFLDAALSKLTKILKQQDHWEKLKEYMYAER